MATRFRNTMTHKQGTDPAQVIRGRVINVNMVNWTVDVISQFDRKYFNDIQVGAAYLHYNSGEGIYAVPDLGAVVMITIPSDSSPPYVQSFVMPMEVANAKGKFNDPDQTVVTDQNGTQTANTSDVDDSDAPDGTRSRGGAVPHPEVDARFDGGRPPAKPGDIVLRGRDGNYVVLHRGGVLEIGATELAKRIFIPIGNKLMDISGQYEHTSTGGSIWWGLQEGPSVNNPPTQLMETYRLYANDKYADLRIARGKVFKPVPEPAGNTATSEMGFDPIIVYEVALAKQGFKTQTGELVNGGTVNEIKLKFFFDIKGNVFLRSEASAYFAFKKAVRVEIGDALDVTCTTLSIRASSGAVLDGGPSTEIKGEVVRIQAGELPIARQGDGIQGGITIPALMTGTIQVAPLGPNPIPFTAQVTIPTGIVGSITSGNPNLLG